MMSGIEAQKAKVLVIPHQPGRGVRVRSVEMARQLAATGAYEVYVLTWEPAAPTRHAIIQKVLTRSLEAMDTMRTRVRIEPEGNLRWVRLPHLMAPYPFCQGYNEEQLARFIRQERIDAVISASAYLHPVPRPETVGHPFVILYDVVDDHLSPESGPAWRRTRRFTLRELSKANHIMTVSHGLQALLEAEGFGPVHLVPNGVEIQSFQQSTPQAQQAVEAIRERYRLHGKFTVGYIGNHGWWAGLRFLLETFNRFHETFPESRLLIVGPGEEVEQLQPAYASEWIQFTGPVPPEEVSAYFHAIDLGVLPFELSPFTHHALPIKILEYGAARKPVLASPLKELETLSLPHVQLLPLHQAIWQDALTREAQTSTEWNPLWDDTLRRYDWQLLMQKVDYLLDQSLGSRRLAEAAEAVTTG
jgi:glycosyltransferase involved in cell wall biosynthesis